MASGINSDEEIMSGKSLQHPSVSPVKNSDSTVKGTLIESDVPSGVIEPEGNSQTGGGRQTRLSFRVKWRETASGNFDNEEVSENVGLQAIGESAAEQPSDTSVGRRLTVASIGPHINNNMGGLLDGDSVDIRVIITGMHRVGKTCLAECLSNGDKQVVNPGRDIVRPQRRFPGHPYQTAVVTPRTCCYVTFLDSPMLTSWPTDELAEWDSFRFPFISKAHAIILAFDLTCPESFDYVKRVKAAIITAAEQQSLVHCPPLFIVGNKADAPRNKSLPRKEDIESLVTKTWLRELEVTTCESLHYCEVSAATGWKVHDLLGTLVLNHLEQHISLGEAATVFHQRQRQKQMRRAAKMLDKRIRRAHRRRQSAMTPNNCLTQ